MKSLPLLLLAVSVAGCHAGFSPILNERAASSPTYAFVVVDTAESPRVEARLAPSQIVSRYEESGHVAYVVAPGEGTVGFAQLERATLKIRVRSVSERGRGEWLSVEATGEPASAFAELKAFERSPWATLESHHPEILANVAAAAPAHALDRGFSVELEIDLVGARPDDPSHAALLYSMRERSPSLAAAWGVAL